MSVNLILNTIYTIWIWCVLISFLIACIIQVFSCECMSDDVTNFHEIKEYWEYKNNSVLNDISGHELGLVIIKWKLEESPMILIYYTLSFFSLSGLLMFVIWQGKAGFNGERLGVIPVVIFSLLAGYIGFYLGKKGTKEIQEIKSKKQREIWEAEELERERQRREAEIRAEEERKRRLREAEAARQRQIRAEKEAEKQAILEAARTQAEVIKILGDAQNQVALERTIQQHQADLDFLAAGVKLNQHIQNNALQSHNENTLENKERFFKQLRSMIEKNKKGKD